jgi:uncharacterized membrane protein SpoIIM required for sporulation
MLEELINPKRAERKPWEMFFMGIIFTVVSIVLANFLFGNNVVFNKHLSLLIITFVVMFSVPFMFYIIKLEEKKDEKIKKEGILIKEHSKAINALMFLFLGFLVAFSLAYMVLPRAYVESNFDTQLQTFCSINMPGNMQGCVEGSLDISTKAISPSFDAGMNRVASILANNFYVLIFCLLFSLLFGAGAIFILAWNASVIAAAIGIYARNNIANLPLGFARYMIHGLPEIGSYFIAALAGGIISVALIKHEFKHEKFWHILEDSIDLIILAFVVLVLAAFIEVFITPAIF